MLSDKWAYTDFSEGLGPITQNDGTVSSGVAGEINLFTAGGIPWVYQVIGTQTVLSPGMNASGLDLTLTDTNGQGGIFVPHSNTTGNPLCYTVGTDPAFYCEWDIQCTDWSGAQVMVGFEGGAVLPALTATFANYTDKATIGNYAGGAVNVYTSQNINNAADTDTDTTIDLTDGDVMRARVAVSSAGAVTYSLSIAPTATPTTFTAQSITSPTQQTFDDGDVLVPFLFTISHTDTATLRLIRKFECGLATS